MYNHPANSANLKPLNIGNLDILEKDIAKFFRVGKIVIAGDLSTHTCILQDFMEDDEDKYLPLADYYDID